MALENLNDLENEWAQFTLNKSGERAGWTQDQRWRDDNCGKKAGGTFANPTPTSPYGQLLAYRNSGGPRPNLPVGTGSRMVFHIDAYLKAKGTVQPPPTGRPIPPVAPKGTLQVLDGGGTTASFPQAFPRGEGPLSVRSLHVKRVTGMGVGSMSFWPPPAGPTALTTIEDCIAEDVQRPAPGSAGGTSEANFWIGNTTQANRLIARRTGWMGMFTGSKCWESSIEDFLIEEVPVGIYIEHITHNTVFKRFKIDKVRDQPVAGGSEPGEILRARSISIEWWYRNSSWGNQVVGSYNLTFEDGEIYCPAPQGAGDDVRAGVYIGPGTYGVKFIRCRFFGPGNAILAPNQRANNGADVVTSNCWFDNDGAEIRKHNHAMGT